jgi:1-aminocyclopropane-1-carboxylate deaminase/D-cysteine desulfhydrase-like pyridoxal-dependent ACC family enzyme
VPADSAALHRLASLPALDIGTGPTIVEALPRLGRRIAPAMRLFAKRDDAIPFGFGGNKIRKLRLVAAEAQAAGADTLITCGGVQSNHARATAAVAARLGMRCILIANGQPQPRPTANALLARVLGADVRHVASREERQRAMDAAADESRAAGGHPFVIPLGASTPLGAAALALAIGELLDQMPAPDVILHASSSGGTQAGLVAGCRLHRIPTRVIGVSADDPAPAIDAAVRHILHGLEEMAGVTPGHLARAPLDIDDTFVGPGYGLPTSQSDEAIRLAAHEEALFLDTTYTAKAMAAVVARGRAGEFDGATVVFWHTGGQVGLFA